MKTYFWQQNQMQWWVELINKQAIPHAILLKGEKGTGKKVFAKAMSMVLLCENRTQSGACLECPSCQLFQANNHLDCIHVCAEDHTIKVDQVRALTESVNLSSTRGNHQVVVIDDVEKFNVSAANAILKTLEEPPAKTHIIMTCNEFDRLLPTIKSRCVKMEFPIPAFNNVKDWMLTELNASEESIAQALHLSNGAPLAAKELLMGEYLEEVKSMINDLNQVKDQDVAISEVAKLWIQSNKFSHLGYISRVLLGQYRNSLFSSGSNSDRELQGFQIVKCNNNKALLNFINQIHVLRKRLNTPLKKELLIEELLINWQNI